MVKIWVNSFENFFFLLEMYLHILAHVNQVYKALIIDSYISKYSIIGINSIDVNNLEEKLSNFIGRWKMGKERNF